MVSVQGTWMRGGTSKGLVVRRDWLDSLGETSAEEFLLSAFGSPDATQIDGIGGGVSTASKVMIVDPVPDLQGRIRYEFAQVAVETAVVDYGGNCGNMTAAVAAFVVNEGLVPLAEPVTNVLLHNLNTNIDVAVEVPTVNHRAATAGTYVQAGVPRSGAEIVCRYLEPGGSVFDGVLPTGREVDELEVEGLGKIEVSIVDVSNPLVFVRASDLGIEGVELPSQLNADRSFLRNMETLRGTAAVRLGIVAHHSAAVKQTPGIPKLCIVAPPRDYTTSRRDEVAASDINLMARIMSVQRVHLSFALTGIMCTSAATLIPGTIPWQLALPRRALSDGQTEFEVAIGHPQGVTTAIVGLSDGPSKSVAIPYVGVSRTARLLMEGMVYAEV